MKKERKQDGRATLNDILSILMREPGLTCEEKVLWALYRSYETVKRGGFPGDDVLAAHMGKSVRSVQAYRSRLVRAGYLSKDFRGPNPAEFRAKIPQEAPQSTATLEDESTAAGCEASGKASQEAPQEAPQSTAVIPPHPPIEDEYGSTGVVARCIQGVCDAMGRSWDHSQSIGEWAAKLGAEFNGVDLKAVALDAAHYLGTARAKRKRYKSPSAFLRNQLKMARERNGSSGISSDFDADLALQEHNELLRANAEAADA